MSDFLISTLLLLGTGCRWIYTHKRPRKTSQVSGSSICDSTYVGRLPSWATTSETTLAVKEGRQHDYRWPQLQVWYRYVCVLAFNSFVLGKDSRETRLRLYMDQ